MTATATLFFSFLFLPLAYCAPPPATHMTSTSLDGHTQFVRSRCNLTHYPDLCFTSLSSYATAVGCSLPELARVATNVTLAQIRAFRAHVSALRRAGAGAAAALGRTEAALRDCVEQLGDAADQVYRTSNELRGVEALGGMQVTWRVSNAQTWMSAALTNEESCSDGFREVTAASSDGSRGGGSGIDVKTDIFRRVMKVKQYTSNALALVNSLVDGR